MFGNEKEFFFFCVVVFLILNKIRKDEKSEEFIQCGKTMKEHS